MTAIETPASSTTAQAKQHLATHFLLCMERARRSAKASQSHAWELEAAQSAPEDVHAAKIDIAKGMREVALWDRLYFSCQGKASSTYTAEEWEIVAGAPTECPHCEHDDHTEFHVVDGDALHVECKSCGLGWQVTGVESDVCPECGDYEPGGLTGETRGELGNGLEPTACCARCDGQAANYD